jgi:hypothetical protein
MIQSEDGTVWSTVPHGGTVMIRPEDIPQEDPKKVLAEQLQQEQRNGKSDWVPTRKFRFDNSIVVEVSGLSINAAANRAASCSIRGIVRNSGGFTCTFEIYAGGRKSKLTFKNAFIFDGEDPFKIAIAVKQALRAFVLESEYVPPPMRKHLCDAILNHHLQDKP